MGIRECDLIDHLRLKNATMLSNCNAVLKNGQRLEVLMLKNKPVVEIENQFFHANEVPGFERYELKPVAAPIPQTPVHLPDKPVADVPVDTSGARLRMQLARNSDAIYRRNVIRQVFGSLEVKEFLGVGEQDSTTRYWACKCKLTGKSIVATQADLTVGAVACCKNAKTPSERIVHRGGQLT